MSAARSLFWRPTVLLSADAAGDATGINAVAGAPAPPHYEPLALLLGSDGLASGLTLWPSQRVNPPERVHTMSGITKRIGVRTPLKRGLLFKVAALC